MRGKVGIGVGSGYGLASTGGEATHTLTTGEMPSHTHTSNAIGGNIGLAQKTGIGTVTALDNTSGEIDNTNLLALTIDNTGGGESHNNMQPYVVLRYLIKI